MNSFGNPGITLDQYLAQIGSQNLKQAIGCYFGQSFNPKYAAYANAHSAWAAKQTQSTRTPSAPPVYRGSRFGSLAGLGASTSDPVATADVASMSVASVAAELKYYESKWGPAESGAVSSDNPLGLASEASYDTALRHQPWQQAQYEVAGGNDRFYVFPLFAANLSAAAQLYLWNLRVVFDAFDAARFYCYSSGGQGPVTGNIGVKVLRKNPCMYRFTVALLNVYYTDGQPYGAKMVASARKLPVASGIGIDPEMQQAAVSLAPYMIATIGNGALPTGQAAPIQMPNTEGSGGGGASANLGINQYSPFNPMNRAVAQSGCEVTPWQTALLHFVVAAVVLIGSALAIGAVSSEGVSTAAGGAGGSGGGLTSGGSLGDFLGSTPNTSFGSFAQSLGEQTAAQQGALASQVSSGLTSSIDSQLASEISSSVASDVASSGSWVSSLLSTISKSGGSSLLNTLSSAASSSAAKKAAAALLSTVVEQSLGSFMPQAQAAKAAQMVVGQAQVPASSTNSSLWVILGVAALGAVALLA